MKKSNIPAVVLGMELNGLGVVRSLAHAGVPVIAVDNNPSRPGMRCRYGQKHLVHELYGAALVQDLVELGRSLPQKPVLFVTQEATVQTVTEYREELSRWYRLTLGEPACIRILTDKKSFHRLAVQNDFNVPKSLNINDEYTLIAARGLRFPVILKPAKRDVAYSRHFQKAYRVEDINELKELCRKIIPIYSNLVVQEWVEGTDADIYFCLQYVDDNGEPVASFTGRKIRSWPPQTGGTASCTSTSLEIAKQLSAETTRFFKVAGFTGMGSMEYKRDAISGRFYLIEPTVGRTDYQEEVATLNGINIPMAAWHSAIGAHSPPQIGNNGKRIVWRNTSIDRRSAQLQSQHCGRDELDSGKKLDAWWRWSDPMPSATMLWRHLGPAMHKRIKRLRIRNEVSR